MGEGDVIRSPPVPSRELECLKEIPQEHGDIVGWNFAYCIFVVLIKSMQVSE